MDDLLRADPTRGEGLWLVPVSTASSDTPRAWVRRLRREGRLMPRPTCYPADLYLAPRPFARVVERWLRAAPQPYLSLVVRSSVGRDPVETHHTLANLEGPLRRRQHARFVFTTPDAALALLAAGAARE